MKNQKQSTACFSFLIAMFCLIGQTAGFAMTADELEHRIKDNNTSFYHEFVDNIVYKQFVKVLQFDRLTQAIKKSPALDINPFDEVPDSAFFVNRQGKQPLSTAELLQGSAKGIGPDPGGPWRIIKGKMEGVSVGLFIQDIKGDRYLLKFDPKEYPEMTTSAEVISHKFFHAFGYHVAEYYLLQFKPDIFEIDPKATYYNDDGFKKQFDEAALESFLEKIPKFKGGIIRASASKILGNVEGYTPFEGRRKDDPDDLIPHEFRRSIRGLRVFGAWLNHYDLREGNTLDVVEEENGAAFLKHYLIDFGSTLGSAASHPKVPAAGYEHIIDWYEVAKATPTLKVVEKQWEQRWDEQDRKISFPAIGYFDNSRFDPGTWKTQLPYEVFDRLTASDAFWAAKIIMSFSDENIRAVVDSAKFSDSEDAKIMSSILIARRNIIGRYWFARVTPLDRIQLSEHSNQNGQIEFEDLNVKHGFAAVENTTYRFKLEFSGQDGKATQVSHQEFNSSPFSFTMPSQSIVRMTIWIQARYGNDGAWSEPPLKIVLGKSRNDVPFSIVEIDHGL